MRVVSGRECRGCRQRARPPGPEHFVAAATPADEVWVLPEGASSARRHNRARGRLIAGPSSSDDRGDFAHAPAGAPARSRGQEHKSDARVAPVPYTPLTRPTTPHVKISVVSKPPQSYPYTTLTLPTKTDVSL